MSTRHATRTGRRAFWALCAAGLLSGAPALAAEMSDVETAPGTAQAAPAGDMTAMADPGAMPAHEAAAPGMSEAPAKGSAMPAAAGPADPAFSAAVVAALNAYYHGDYNGAADRLNAAAAENPADPAAPYFLGYTYYRMGEFAKARTAFAQAYQVDPHFSPEPPASK